MALETEFFKGRRENEEEERKEEREGIEEGDKKEGEREIRNSGGRKRRKRGETM